MTDRELLELAATAAGYEYTQWAPLLHPKVNWGVCTIDGLWNPLTDDGDALRLAVTLGMLFTYMHDRFDMFQKFYREELDNDLKPSEATRRAIVRTAAEIGKTM